MVDASAENGGFLWLKFKLSHSSFLPLALTVSDRHKARLNEARQVTRTSHASTPQVAEGSASVQKMLHKTNRRKRVKLARKSEKMVKN